jgi:hypothetical protein
MCRYRDLLLLPITLKGMMTWMLVVMMRVRLMHENDDALILLLMMRLTPDVDSNHLPPNDVNKLNTKYTYSPDLLWPITVE